jgi:hypothetical protein
MVGPHGSGRGGVVALWYMFLYILYTFLDIFALRRVSLDIVFACDLQVPLKVSLRGLFAQVQSTPCILAQRSMLKRKTDNTVFYIVIDTDTRTDHHHLLFPHPSSLNRK